MCRRRASSPPLGSDPGRVVLLVVVEDRGQWGRRQKQYWEKLGEKNICTSSCSYILQYIAWDRLLFVAREEGALDSLGAVFMCALCSSANETASLFAAVT